MVRLYPVQLMEGANRMTGRVVCAAALLVIVVLPAAATLSAQDRLVDDFESLDGWKSGGQKEIRFDLSDRHVKQGRFAFHFHIEVDHQDTMKGGKPNPYPMGWPSVTREYASPIDLSAFDFLEMDIYFENTRGVDPDFGLHFIAKDSHGRAFYSTTFTDLKHGQWAHEKLCIRDLRGARDLGELHFFISESDYDHGDVIDFSIDNLRATRAVEYRPPEIRPVRHPLAKSDAAVLWLEGSCDKVRRTDVVDLQGPADPVFHIWSARNETEAVQLVVRPLASGGVGEVRVELSPLIGPDRAQIGEEHVSWSPVAYVPAKEGPPEGLPDGLPGGKPFVADKPWQYPIWLEVYVPPGTPAGDYAAPVTVRTERGDLNAGLRLHVWDFDVPVRQSLRTNTTIYGPYGWREDIQKWFGDMDYWTCVREWTPKIVRLLARYRLCPSHLYHLPLAYDDKTKSVVLQDTSEFERYARMYLELGHHFNSMPVPYFFDRPSFLGAKKGTPEYLDRITAAYRVAAEYLDRKGWMDGSYVYCVDEVVVHRHTREVDLTLLNQVFEAIHAAHPKIRIFGAETPSPVLRGMDVWCMNIGSFDEDVLHKQHALGHQVWWYNGYQDPRPGTRVAARGVDHRALAWITWKYGIDGYLVWTVNRWSNNPWETPNPPGRGPAGDHYLLFPNPDGTVSPSLRLCMLRDGFEDYEYHVLLADAVKRLRTAGQVALAEECEEVLQHADAFILAYDNCAPIQPNFIYDSRRLLADQIETALAALKATAEN